MTMETANYETSQDEADIPDNIEENEISMEDTQCGFGPWKPAWLQKFASKKSYVIIYGLTGMSHMIITSYFIATITTIEKRFKFPSKYSGLIVSAWDVGNVLTCVLASYLGRNGHKTRWIACGTALAAISCYVRLIPHWLYGPGENALSLTKEFGVNGSNYNKESFREQNLTLCGNGYTAENENCYDTSSGYTTALIFFIGHLMLGIGGTVYYTLGITYLDDNIRKNKTIMSLAFTQCVRMFGPTFGYLLATYTLKIYVDPDLTPTIDDNDSRWTGAWWMGWNPLGLLAFTLAIVTALFPRQLPRAAIRRAQDKKIKTHKSFADFRRTVKRLASNKILVCNCLSSTCMVFGFIGQWVFLPKYMETQFRQSASNASLISGSVGLLFTGAGVILAGIVITRFKPSARVVAAWNVIVESFDVLGFLIIAFISCDDLNLQGTTRSDGTLDLNVACNSNCSCDDMRRYSPVCDISSGTTHFSACHAGCTMVHYVNSTIKSFSSCACVENSGAVTQGSCPIDCSQAFMIFLIIQCIQRFLAATGRSGNALIHLRCISVEDKPMAIGLSEFIMCVCAFFPGPIVFGYVIDLSCIVWGQTCGKTGNCLLYDVNKLRLYVNLPMVGCMLLGTVWDIGVWYYVRDLQLYEDDEPSEEKTKMKQEAGVSDADETL